MFETDGDAHQPVSDAKFGALRRGKPLVRGRRRMGDEALGVAEIVADADELERVLEAKRRLFSPLDVECDQRRAATHLLLRDLRLPEVRLVGVLLERALLELERGPDVVGAEHLLGRQVPI